MKNTIWYNIIVIINIIFNIKHVKNQAFLNDENFISKSNNNNYVYIGYFYPNTENAYKFDKSYIDSIHKFKQIIIKYRSYLEDYEIKIGFVF